MLVVLEQRVWLYTIVKNLIIPHHSICLNLFFFSCTTHVLIRPSMHSQHLFFFSFFLSLFPPRNPSLALYTFISALQIIFLLILSLIFFIFIFFVLIPFSIFLLFLIASSFNFFVYQIWSSFFWFFLFKIVFFSFSISLLHFFFLLSYLMLCVFFFSG
jgi:hypothetical protein